MREATALVEGLKLYPTLGEDDPHGAKREAFIQGYLAARAAAPQAQEVRQDDRVRLSHASRTLSFFKGIIQSGEEWSESCQQNYDLASTALLNILDRPTASPPSGDAVRETIARIIDPRNFEMNEISANQYTTDGIKEALRKADVILASLPPRVDAVREALEPFAKIGLDILENRPGWANHVFNSEWAGYRLTYVDFERAVVAMSSISDASEIPLLRKKIDKYGIALMMISQGCANPISIADKALNEGWRCKACGWQGEMPNTKVLPDAMGTAQVPCCPDCDQHAALALPSSGAGRKDATP